MQQKAFHAYHIARELDNMRDEDCFSSAFASSDVKIFPFQIAAAAFALRSPYQKGAVLCDEAVMGKSHEAMLVIMQKWMEGCNRILLVTPNAELLRWEYMKKQESQFFDAMRLDLELERRIKEFTEKEKMTARVTREFVLKVEGIKNGC